MERNSLMKEITVLLLLRESRKMRKIKLEVIGKYGTGTPVLRVANSFSIPQYRVRNALMLSPRPPYRNDTRGRSFYLQEDV